MQDRTEFLLTEKQAKDPLLETRPSFGPGDPGYIEDGSIQAWIGTRPVVYDIRKFLKAHDVKAPGTFHLLEHHDIWLVYFAFGIDQASVFRDVVRARLEIQYNSEPLVTVYQPFPSTEFLTWSETGGTFRAQFQLSEDAGAANGNGKRKIGNFLGSTRAGGATLEVGARVALSLNLKVATPFVTSTGINNDYGLWELRRYDLPLIGDHQVGHILLVRRPVLGPVTAKLRLSLDVGTFSFLTSARFTDWVPVTLEVAP